MYFVYGCPKVLSLKSHQEQHGAATPSVDSSTNVGREEILAIAFNPSGSLLAVASTSRICVWSGGKDHVPLGSTAVRLRAPSSGGSSLLWRRDSGAVGVVSAAGKVVLVSITRKTGRAPTVGERFAVPDWFEPQHARTPTEDESSADRWADPGEADVVVKAVVEQIFSDVSAMCIGRFGQHLLVATTDGEIYGVSWEGQILCRYGVVAMPAAVSRDGGERGPRSSPTHTRFADVYATSMSFNDTLQLLALTTADGSFFLGTLSKDHCWLRYIAITEQALAHRQHTRHASASAHVAARSAEDAAGSRGSGDVRGRDDGDRHARSSSWSWDLWGKGREVVMAAATAAADALSSPRSSSQQGGGFSRTWPGDHGHSSPAAVNAGQRHRDFGAVGDNRSRDGRATAVEFSAKGGLMAVALVDGTVLLTRVERYTSGVRAHHKLQISSSMLHRSDSYRLQIPPDESSATVGQPESVGNGQAEVEEDLPAKTALLRERSSSMGSLWGVEVHHLHCLSLEQWVGDGGDSDGGGFAGPAGRVLSMCFSFDGWALSVGHEHALTVWSTEDGTRLMCTLSDTHRRRIDSEHTSPVARPVPPTPSDAAGTNSVSRPPPPPQPYSALNADPTAQPRERRRESNGEATMSTDDGADAAKQAAGSRGCSAPQGSAGHVEEGDRNGGIASGAPRATGGTLDLIAGGARSLTWGSEGYRLLSVGGAIPDETGRWGGAGADGVGGRAQGIVAFDFLRRARSNLSSALLSLQGSDRIALVDSQPWSAQVLLWRVLPVHPGYLSANAPLRHVSTSRAGTYVAVAGSRGLAIYNRPTGRWRLFGNIEQEQDVEVAGMCWWGESALVVASRLKHGFVLLLYSRKHLDAQSLLLPPIRLPVGLRPLFMQGVQEGGTRPTTDVLFLLVAGSGSYLLYRFSCDGDILERGNVSFSVLHEGALPHVLENMDDMRQLDQVAGLGTGAPPVKNTGNSQTPIPPPPSTATSTTTTTTTTTTSPIDDSGDHRQPHTDITSPPRDTGNRTDARALQTGDASAAGVAPPSPGAAASMEAAAAGKAGTLNSSAQAAAGEPSTNGNGMASERGPATATPSSPPPPPGGGGAGLLSPGYAGSGVRVKATGLPVIGPPKRVMLLPEVHPRCIALLDYDGNLVTMQLSNGEVKAVAEGVESVVDLSGVSEAWEAWEMPLLIHPCYLLRRRGKVGGGGGVGGGGWGQGSMEKGDSEEMSEEYSVWCPAMRLDPCPPSVQRLLRGGGGVREALSPVLSLNPGASCDPERVDLGLQPLLGTMVHVSQVVCRPRVANTPPLPPCYELRTHLRPILHMVLRHLLIVSQLQLLDCPLPSQPPAAVPRSDARRQSALSLVGTGSGSLLDRRSEEGRSGGRGDGSRFGGILRRHSSAGITAVEANQSGSRDGFDAGTSASGSGRYEVAEPEREAPPAATGLSGETAGRSGGSGGSGDSDVLGDVERSKRGTMQGGDGAVEGGGHAIEHAGKAGQDRGGAAGPAGETERDWIGTSSDAFEIAVAVLKRCREDDVLVEALPDTLELLVRACMEALNLAGPRARKAAAVAASASAPPSHVNGNSGRSNGISDGGSIKPIYELELARAVMTDCVYLAQLAPECFHEVIARVARKAEPELYSLLFPLHLVSGGGAEEGGVKVDGLEGEGGGVRKEGEEDVGVGSGGWGKWVHPTHLFHECVLVGRLTTAAWYLPLVRDDVAYDASQRDAGRDGPLSDEERESFMPLDMWALLSKDWSFGLSHALACVLLAESLSAKQHALLPEVWMFATKREQSTPLHHLHNLENNPSDNGQHRKYHRRQRSSQQSASSNSYTNGSTSSGGNINDGRNATDRHYWSTANAYRMPWFKRGQGAVMEAANAKASAFAREAANAADAETKAATKAARNRGKDGRHRTGDRRASSGGFGSGVLGANLSWALRRDSGLLASEGREEEDETEMEALIAGMGGGRGAGQGTLFARRSALRMRALRRPNRLGDGATEAGAEEGDRRPDQITAGGNKAATAHAAVTPATVGKGVSASATHQRDGFKRMDSERGRLYHLPFSRDAASVVSRFLWKQLNELKVKLVLKTFQSLASSPAAREAGLDPGKVLGALTPARRSMVGNMRCSPEGIMAGVMVALAEMFKASTEELALIAVPVPPSDPAATAASSAATPSPAPLSEVGTRAEKEQQQGRTQAVATGHHSSSVVRPQLLLLGDLSQAVGHAEAALVCASLLRDQDAAVAILSNASQTLRVGYTQFVSDLKGQLQKARSKATECSTATPASGGAVISVPSPPSPSKLNTQQLPSAGEARPRAEAAIGVAAKDSGLGGVGEGVTAANLLELQRFCIKCLASV